MLATPVGTVSVSALLWLPMPKLVMKPVPALNGEHQSCAVSLATIQVLRIKGLSLVQSPNHYLYGLPKDFDLFFILSCTLTFVKRPK